MSWERQPADPCLRQVIERKFYRYYSSRLFCLVTVLLLDRTIIYLFIFNGWSGRSWGVLEMDGSDRMEKRSFLRVVEIL